MAAEHDEPQALARILGGFVAAVVRRPILWLAAALCVAAGSGWLTATKLEFHTSRLNLLNPNSEYNKRWINYIREFGDDDDVVVVVAGGGKEAVLPVMEQVANRLQADEETFRNVLWRVDLRKVRSKGLYYLSQEDLLQTEGFLQRLTPILKGDWSQLNLGNLLAGLTYQLHQMQQANMPPPRQEIDQLSASLLAAMDVPESYRSPFPAPAQEAAAGQRNEEQFELIFAEGKIGVVLCQFAPTNDGFATGATGVDRIRAILTDVRSKLPAGVEIGLTGLPVMENDEMRASQSTSTWATALSFLGVALLFWAGFGNWKHTLYSIVTLAFGMVFAFGFVVLAVGHLNILTVSFAVMLIGLGIDFPVHYCARYLSLREEGMRRDDALTETAKEIGPGVVTGMLTTAAAFYVASFTEFTGVAELGVIAGGGVLICGFLTFWVLPALIRWFDDADHVGRTAPQLPLGDVIMAAGRAPWATGVACLALTGVGVFGLNRLWYDHNLLNLQPKGLESVLWEHRLLSETQQSAWYALSISDDPAELLKRKEQFLRMPSVSRVEEVASLVPQDSREKTEMIQRVSEQLQSLRSQPPIIPMTAQHELAGWSQQLSRLLAASPGNEDLLQRLRAFEEKLRTLPPTEYYARCGRFQQRLADDLWEKLQGLRQAAHPAPPTLADLPGGLVHRFVGKNGKFLLKIYASGSIWDMDQLQRFVADVRTVDAEATGKPLQTYEASRQMLACYQQAALYATIAIVILLLLDFQHVGYSLLALLPLILGTVEMFGAMGVLGIPLNPANIIALPVVLGIGIDNGVHVVHDFRRTRTRYRLSNSTANALLLCSLTTILGFGSLMIADHRGIESLGRVMVIGCGACLFNSMVVLPVILNVLTAGRDEKAAETTGVPETSAESGTEADDPDANREEPVAPRLHAADPDDEARLDLETPEDAPYEPAFDDEEAEAEPPPQVKPLRRRAA